MSSNNGIINDNDDQAFQSYLLKLTPEQRQEALAAAAAAKRAEERAEQRALERALQQKEEERKRQQQQEFNNINNRINSSNNNVATNDAASKKIIFIPKRKREQLKQQQQEQQQQSENKNSNNVTYNRTTNNVTGGDTGSAKVIRSDTKKSNNFLAAPTLTEKERNEIVKTYMGKTAMNNNSNIEDNNKKSSKKKQKKTSNNKKITFRFRWDETDDTFNNDDDDLLYAPIINNSNGKTIDDNKQKNRNRKLHKYLITDEVSNINTVTNKPLEQMTARDWRIYRENYEIIVKGGKAPPPMRSFHESPTKELPKLHPALLDAIDNVMHFKHPSPIQRQAIPIGLQRRDLIGIAETGSGKTVAFGVPLCHYLLNLPNNVLRSVSEQGPLALIMAPTRELALQIDVEINKLLSCQRIIKSCAVVGGQPIQQQAQAIRRGVHIIVGTPGRINDCIEMAYLVLNQCCYIVMDEADRMVDMGFQSQMESILDAMGGSLKSEDENETYKQEVEDLKASGVARHRLTAMFSATMPTEVEQIAKRYLRHPAIVKIGDKDSGKNTRIVQNIIWLASPSKKEDALRDLLRDPRFIREKIIVFVNEKKHADGVGRMVEKSGRHCVVLHGGKSQEHREENLETFRRGGVVMVATDVAGRGLDIPDVAHVINYDLPTRSIENYTHRIGRTGRAGKDGYATSFITEEDEGIMAALKSYLESTGNQVPQRLARHPAAQSVSDVDAVIY